MRWIESQKRWRILELRCTMSFLYPNQSPRPFINKVIKILRWMAVAESWGKNEKTKNLDMTGSRTRCIPLRNLEVDATHFPWPCSEMTTSRRLPENNTLICTPLLAIETSPISTHARSFARVMLFSQTRPEVCYNLEYFVASFHPSIPPNYAAPEYGNIHFQPLIFNWTTRKGEKRTFITLGNTR